jgi:hypothetical protein
MAKLTLPQVPVAEYYRNVVVGDYVLYGSGGYPHFIEVIDSQVVDDVHVHASLRGNMIQLDGFGANAKILFKLDEIALVIKGSTQTKQGRSDGPI